MFFMPEEGKEEECVEGCEGFWWDSNGEQGRKRLFKDQPQPVSSCTSAVCHVTHQDLNNVSYFLQACQAKAWILCNN